MIKRVFIVGMVAVFLASCGHTTCAAYALEDLDVPQSELEPTKEKVG